MPYPHEHAARLKDPDRYERFRRENNKFGPGIHAIWGITADGKVELQAIRFDASRFTVAEARAWLKEHGYKPIRFEPASEGKTEAQSDGPFDCECLDCGYQMRSEKHCRDIRCPQCGGDMRRVERPGPGQRGTAAAIELKLVAQANDEAPVRVHGIAYNGGLLELNGWRHPVVIDLEGLSIPDAVPLLVNHENRTGSRIGVVRAEVRDGALYIEGEVLSSSSVARGVVEQARAGADWQLSVGVDAQETEVVSDSKTVNGKALKGPFHHVKRSVLREVSVLPIAADMRTSLRIAAGFSAREVEAMNQFEKWLEEKGWKPDELTQEQVRSLRAAWEAEVKPSEGEPKAEGQNESQEPDPAAELRAKAAAEAKRQAEVLRICGTFRERMPAEQVAQIQAKSLEEGWDALRTEVELLRAERPKAPTVVARTEEQGPKVLEAALCLGTGLREDAVVKACGEQAVEAARSRYGGPIGARMFILEAAWANGFTDRHIHTGNLRAALQAAFSTQSASGILSNVANKVLLDAYSHVESAWREIARIRPVNDFKQVTHYRLTGDMQYEEVGPGGELKHAATNEESYTVQARTYGKIFAITRQDIINDDLGAFDDLRTMLGRGAALKINNVFWTEFLDNSSFFTAARSNYATGAATALSVTSLSTAEKMFMDQTDADGHPLGVSPKKLLVPTALKSTGWQILNSVELAEGSSSKAPTRNPHAGQYDLVVSAYLGNSSYTGYSTAAWYLLADAADLAVIEVVFLNGKETPTVESADADFDTLGVLVRGYHDFGVSKAEYRAGVKMKGEA